MKNIRVFLSENFQFLEVKFSVYLNRRVFVMRQESNPHPPVCHLDAHPTEPPRLHHDVNTEYCQIQSWSKLQEARKEFNRKTVFVLVFFSFCTNLYVVDNYLRIL